MSTVELKTDATPRLVNADELMRESSDHPCELINGKVVRMSPTGWDHGSLELRIGQILSEHVNACQLGQVVTGEVGCLISRDPDTVLAPDVAYASKERLAAGAGTRGYFSGAPDLVVEVVSPSQTAPRVHEKARMWVEAGCRAVWLVWPDDRSVTVYRSLDNVKILTDDAVLDGGDVVPGFSHPIAQFFGEAS